MAIQTIDLKVPGGDTPRSANTKINANFTNTGHAASKLVGTATGQLALNENLFAAMSTTWQGEYAIAGEDINTLNNKKYWLVRNTSANYPSDARASGGNGVTDNYGIIMPFWANNNGDVGVQVFIGREKGSVATRAFTSGNSTPSFSSWAVSFSTANATVDSNGFVKAASPIVKVFADKVELNDDAAAQDVTFVKNGVGDYTITTVSGLSTDGWYIELPKDINGNPKLAVTLTETEGVISLKCYKRVFSMETFTFVPDLDEPMDVPDGRWIDLRLNEIPQEPMPEPVSEV